MRSSARYGAGAAPWTESSSRSRALRITSAASDMSGRLRPVMALLDDARPRTRATRRGTRPARAAGRRSPSSKALRPSSIRFWRIGFSTMNVTAVCGPTSRGTSCVPPQPGMIPRKHSGAAKWRTAVEIVRASQCSAISTPPPTHAPLIAASGRVRERARSGRRARAPRSLPSRGELARRAQRELRDVGAGGEDERLAGQHQRLPVALLELGEERQQRLHRAAAEDVRLPVVLAVVHRHERDRPDARVDAARGGTPSSAQPCRRFSQTMLAPMPMPMQSAVIP